mmetsp:Transcript_12535/g.15750  ORF Transcript_12535/g.15750 Transcript_12535/m.15750 type:complete len:136 (+) Transcript_12535:133-540(+)|eukprot:CAMPEP_0172498954 /NCGR_PEP_ID=MMETSP1066-20121228/120164_1 /TAXON_ID=671091 /ORGANISM="Coscinodiscus wailesii, Strain CCMP2513" /LENGTH=135 /DNA_ID=CAMNT_0013272457 /DNA_START=126 /DNA_END=536 /DNA_ORIENTATION=-
MSKNTDGKDGGADVSNVTAGKRGKEIMEKILGCDIKCTLDDGRTATGKFLCIDRLKNLVLSDVIEVRKIPRLRRDCRDLAKVANNGAASNHSNVDASSDDKHTMYERHLSQAMIPGKHLVKVEVDRRKFVERVSS